jgi:hypothetical protein
VTVRLPGKAAVIDRHAGVPRHQPDLVRQIARIPRTLTGKRMEVPVKRALLDPGAPVPGDPGGLDGFRAPGHQLAAAAAARENSPRAA